MGGLIFSIIKLEFKFKPFKNPQELAKKETLKTTLNLNTIISLHQDLSKALEGLSNSGAEEQIFMSETVVL